MTGYGELKSHAYQNCRALMAHVRPMVGRPVSRHVGRGYLTYAQDVCRQARDAAVLDDARALLDRALAQIQDNVAAYVASIPLDPEIEQRSAA